MGGGWGGSSEETCGILWMRSHDQARQRPCSKSPTCSKSQTLLTVPPPAQPIAPLTFPSFPFSPPSQVSSLKLQASSRIFVHTQIKKKKENNRRGKGTRGCAYGREYSLG